MARGKIGVFTIASKNYLAYVRVLLNSISRIHPEYQLYLCLADRVGDSFDKAAECFEVVQSDQIGIRHHDDMALRYDIMEFNTAIKPFMFEWLFRTTDLDDVIYLDPDICLYGRMDALEGLFESGHSAVLIPHITRPIEDGRNPNDYHMLQAGVFNLGFAAFRRCDDAARFLSWWGRRLETQACVDIAHNLFTDQRWCDLAPCFIDRLHVLKDPGYNIAYWNLTERSLERADDGSWRVNGSPLVFFHFSGIDVANAHLLSKHQDRFDLAQLPACRALMQSYRESVIQAGWEQARQWEYAYARTNEGLFIATIVRQLFRHKFPTSVRLPRGGVSQLLISICTATSSPDAAPVSALMEFIHGQRKDLQAAFNLDTFDGRSAFRAWIETSGMDEYLLPPEFIGNIRGTGQRTDGKTPLASRVNPTLLSADASSVLAVQFNAVEQAAISDTWARLPLSVQRFLSPIVNFMLTNPAADPTDEVSGEPSVSGGPTQPTRAQSLHDPAPIRQLLWEGYHVTVLMHAVWSTRQDLQTNFDLDTPDGQSDFIAWFDEMYPEIAEPPPASADCYPVDARPAPGANLIGYVPADIGMGEHIRMSAAALRETNVQFGLIDFSLGVAGGANAAIDASELLDRNAYAANIFHVNADQIFAAYQHFGHDFFARRYNIGYWAWELAVCPPEMRAATAFIDEIWAPSRFIQQAFGAGSAIPVEHMPLCVHLPEFPPLERRAFRIPEDSYAFLYTFDFLSFLERKNPLAAVRAFKIAFPDRRTRACLIIKVMNCDPKSPQWKNLLQAIDDDDRIVVLDSTLSRPEILALVNCCDCYVSLHRSEGFGRGPAEAMYLGKPVIATNYSGNTDFMTTENSCPVNFRLIPVEDGQYPFSANQQWADADPEHAAWHMLRLHADPAYASTLGARAGRHIRENYSREVIGARYEARLRILKLLA